MKRFLILLLVSFDLAACEPNASKEGDVKETVTSLSQATVKRAEKSAHEACLCERHAVFSGTNGTDCWNEFKRETDEIFDEGYGTSCYPITSNGSCSSKTGQCITTSHQLMLDDGRIPLCTDMEVETFDAAYSDVIETQTARGMDINDADKLAQNEVRKLIELLKSGKPIEPRKSKFGCGS